MEKIVEKSVREKTWKEWGINVGYTLFLVMLHWFNMWHYRHESMFYLYVWLLVYIFSSLFISHVLWKRQLKKKKKRNPPKNIFIKALYFVVLPLKLDFLCLKTSLYLFFAIVLVISQITTLGEIELSNVTRDWLDAMQYGFAPLIAFDQVFNQFRRDQVIFLKEEM